MTDKEKIKVEIERLKESGCASPIVICDTLLAFIDSLQEEPKPKFKVGDCIKPIDSCLGSQRTICEVCDGWYVTNQGTLDFEYDDNWELVEEPKDKCNGCNNAKGCVTCVDGSAWAHLKEASKNYADKEKFRKEVEKLKSNLIYGACSSQITMETICKEEAFNEVLAILETMQEEPVSDELEEEIDWYMTNVYCGETYIEDIARHFANWQREKMMKDAVDGVGD